MIPIDPLHPRTTNLSRSSPFWPLQAAVIDLRFSSSWAHLSSVNAVCSWLLVSTCMSSSLSPLSSISCPKPCTVSVSLTCPASYRSPAVSLEPWYEAAHPLNCLSSVIYKFIDWSCCARRCPLVASGPRSWRIVNTCRPSRGTTRWKLSPLLLLIVWGEHAVICVYSFVFSHGENLHVSLHDLFSSTPSLAFVPIRIFSKWLHRCPVVRAKQAAMQITYGTCPRNSLIYDQPQCVSTSLVKSRVLLC